MVRCIVGGSQTLQRPLSKNFIQAIDKLDSQKKKQQQSNAQNPTLSDRIATIASILTNEELSSTTSSTKNGKNNNNTKDSTDIKEVEVVIISPQLGCHRLDTDQLNAVQKLIKESKEK
jgi:hypothetical protein